jgi:hypothetical protein
LAVEQVEQHVTVDGSDDALADVIAAKRREMEQDGWFFSHQRDAVSAEGERLAGALTLCFWRKKTEGGETADDHATELVAGERPQDWTRA